MFWTPSKKREPKLITVTGKTDGFGSQIQAQYSAIAYCIYKNYQFVYTPMYKMQHDCDCNVMDKFANVSHIFTNINKLTPFQKTQVIEVKEGPIVHGSSHPEFFYTHKVRQIFRECYYSTPKPELDFYKPESKINVAVHIRRGDVTDKRNPSRFTSNSDVIILLKKTSIDLEKSTIHIFSEGDEDDFVEIKKEYPKVQFHLSTDVQTTFHALVRADYLFISKSSFSYSAALLNEGTVNATLIKSWWHKPLKSWVVN
tara:strand:- start:158 stop:925 length:768 start_codon:yes stop_codon:yes gene_type:complete